jgi:hypothetical protein
MRYTLDLSTFGNILIFEGLDLRMDYQEVEAEAARRNRDGAVSVVFSFHKQLRSSLGCV